MLQGTLLLFGRRYRKLARLYKHEEEENVAVSNISIPDSPERITNESSDDPDSTKVVLETEESMVSIEQDNHSIVQAQQDTNTLQQIITDNQDKNLQQFDQDLNLQPENKK